MKTPFRKRRERRDAALAAEYHCLMAIPGAMKTAVVAALMKKYHIHSRTTIWDVLRRVEKQQQLTP